MMFSRFFGAAALAARALAQASSLPSSASSSASSLSSGSITSTPTSTTTSTSTATSSTGVTTHTIAVGAEGFVFTPNQINASVGDVVLWMFYPGGHSVVRSAYEHACIPYEYVGVNMIGFFSGFQYPQTISDNLPTFQITVNNTEPIFYYCSAPGSCVDQHMIGVINANATETFAVQMEYADNSTYQLSPGDAFPSETAAPSSSSTPSSSSGGHGLSGGAIAGIVVGMVAAVAMVGGALFFCGRRGALAALRQHYGSQDSRDPYLETKEMPKSPGQDTFSTNQYTGSYHDPYISPLQSPHGQQFTGSGDPAYGAYPHYGQIPQNSPLMGGLGVQDYYSPMAQQEPVQLPADPSTHPVELPSSQDPGNSPLPEYEGTSSKRFSWPAGAEANYRPSDKAPSS